MEMMGIEPIFPRCDRGVLPLHHIPYGKIQNSNIEIRKL
jgi:hypothetical protein